MDLWRKAADQPQPVKWPILGILKVWEYYVMWVCWPIFGLLLISTSNNKFMNIHVVGRAPQIVPSRMGEYGVSWGHGYHGEHEKYGNITHHPDDLKHSICDSKHAIYERKHSILRHLSKQLKNHNITLRLENMILGQLKCRDLEVGGS